MRQKIVGTFPLGLEYCEVVLREGVGADFYCMPEEGHVPRMKLGADTTWLDVYDSLIHEAMELSLVRMRCRFRESSSEMGDPTAYYFHFNHVDFTEAIGHVSGFLDKAVPVTAKTWRAWKKPPTKKRTRSKR